MFALWDKNMDFSYYSPLSQVFSRELEGDSVPFVRGEKLKISVLGVLSSWKSPKVIRWVESKEKRLGEKLGLFQEDREEGDYFVLKDLKTSL